MTSNQASTLFTAPPTTFFAVLRTTLSILFGPARKLYLQLILVLHIVVSPFYILTILIEVSTPPGGGLGALVEIMFLWIFFTVLVAPFLFTYLFGQLIYGVGKVYAGEVQPTRDSKWMSRLSVSQLGIVFLYALIVMSTCIGSAYCIGFIFETINEIPGWDDWNPTYTKSQMILSLLLYTLGFMLIIPLVGMLLVVFIAVLFERDVSFKQRLHDLCKENFCFIYTRFLVYIFSILLLLALSLQLTKSINNFASVLDFALVLVFVYWWIFVLVFPAITSILPIVLYMSIRARNEELTQESFADDIGLSGSGDVTSPLIPQGDEPSQDTDSHEVVMTSSPDDSSHINEGESQ